MPSYNYSLRGGNRRSLYFLVIALMYARSILSRLYMMVAVKGHCVGVARDFIKATGAA